MGDILGGGNTCVVGKDTVTGIDGEIKIMDFNNTTAVAQGYRPKIPATNKGIIELTTKINVTGTSNAAAGERFRMTYKDINGVESQLFVLLNSISITFFCCRSSISVIFPS